MHTTKNNRVFIIAIIMSVIFTALRSILLYTSYDFTTGFFDSKSLATIYYAVLIVVCAIIYMTKKYYLPAEIKYNTQKNITAFFHLILALLFVGLTYASVNKQELISPLEKITQFIFLASSIISVVYYAVSAFTQNTFTKILNLAPVIFFASFTVFSFIEQTSFANTYNEFSHIISLIALAFLVLEDGKCSLNDNLSPILPTYFISLIVICQSAIPDIITFVTNETYLDVSLGLMAVLKLIYIIYASIKITKSVINTREDNK